MKRLILCVAATAALSLTSLHAQTFSTVKVHFDEPVAVVDSELPAGDYTIRMLETAAMDPLILFRSDSGKSIVAVAERDLRPNDRESPKTDIILDREGSVAHVARIEIEGSATDLVLRVPSTNPR